MSQKNAPENGDGVGAPALTIPSLDYSWKVLKNLQWADPGAKPSEDALQLSDVGRMLEPGYLAYEDGYSRMPDGSIHAAVLTPMPGCQGKMFEWWFSFCDDTPTYQLWHPGDHVEGTWDEGYFSGTKRGDRSIGHHVGHSHIVKEKVGGRLEHLHIDFKDPATIFDTSKFKEAGVTACLVARVNIFDQIAGDVAVGHLVHMVRETPDGACELRSRFWMGHIQRNSGSGLLTAIVNFVGNTRLGRYLRAPSTLGRDIHRHCHEEMRVLASFLPAAYAANHPLQRSAKQ